MATTLLINLRFYETRVALIDGKCCLELYIERYQKKSLVGNIYLGKVVKVLPGMQAAFVDIGLSKAAFLYVGDVVDFIKKKELLKEEPQQKHFLGHKDQRIEKFLKEGQEIVVQVTKEPLGDKGARLTAHISLPGRNLVLMPATEHIGISRRIENENERSRLKNLLEEICPQGKGLIARTVSEGVNGDKIKAEVEFLCSLWEIINQKRLQRVSPEILYQDLFISLRATRDFFTHDISELVVDCPVEYKLISSFVKEFSPKLLKNVKLYTGNIPIFDFYGVASELDRVLDPKIWLRSGGYIVIEKTEALTSIDVNTGRYVGEYNLEDTILKTNLEAVKKIAQQLRLKDIGGLIVIDFIDMEEERHRINVVEKLKEELKFDRSKTNVLDMSMLGLVEMTRKRIKKSLIETLNEPCFYCKGKGLIKSPVSLCYELFRKLEKEYKSKDYFKVSIQTHPRIFEVLLNEEFSSLKRIENELVLNIEVISNDTLQIDQFLINVKK